MIDSRPYLQKYSVELEQLIKDNWNDPIVLNAIVNELRHRKRNHAKLLLNQVNSRLKELQKQQFKWPSTAVVAHGQAFTKLYFDYKDGLLSFLGYRVGETKGVAPSVRREILDYVYHGRLPSVDSIEYMREWANSKSDLRLKKLANTIAAFCRNAKARRNANLEIAIYEWEEDLDYLKRTYYTGRWDFTWPRT